MEQAGPRADIGLATPALYTVHTSPELGRTSEMMGFGNDVECWSFYVVIKDPQQVRVTLK